MDTQLIDDAAVNLPAIRSVSIALRAYNGLARRPRSVRAWAHVECLLWNARQDAVSAGVLKKNTAAYEFISARFHDTRARLETARIQMARGEENPLI